MGEFILYHSLVTLVIVVTLFSILTIIDRVVLQSHLLWFLVLNTVSAIGVWCWLNHDLMEYIRFLLDC